MVPWKNIPRFLRKAWKDPGYAMAVFARRASASFYYRIGQGKSSAPEALTLFLTHRCNLHCKMCGQWGDSGVTRKNAPSLAQELSLDEARLIIDDLATFRPNITLFGGEPLLYPHCAQLIKYIKQKGMHCLTITNGTMLEEQAASLLDSGLDELNVSIDGGEALHDQIRGLLHLYEKITRGLIHIQRLKKEIGRSRPFINIQCTISQYNYLHLEELLEVAREVGANSLTFHNLIFLDQESLERQKEVDTILGCSSLEWQGFAGESLINPELLYDKIHKILSGRYPFNVDLYPNLSRQELIEYYSKKGYAPKEYACRCLSPWIAGYIFPDGEVRPCLNSSYAFGNAKQNKFLELWNGDAARKFRRLLREKKSFPACIRCTELYRY